MTKVIIDTSVWVEYFKGKNSEIVEKVKALIVSERAIVCGVVLSEIVAGLRKQKDEEIMRDALDALPYVETSRESWILAGRMMRELLDRGKKIPLSDLILAASAFEHNSEIFTLDVHFDLLPKIKKFSFSG